MMLRYISANKNEYNVRKVEELNDLILEKEKELVNTKGFINTLKLKIEIKKLYKQINTHGSEVMQYEYIQTNKGLN